MTAPRHGPALPVTDLDSATEALHREGVRLTAARRLVLEALAAATGPVSAERVAAGLDGRLPASDTASVYRNLETLEELGVVRHLHVGHGPGLYTLAGHEREHLLCEHCGALQAVEPRELESVRRRIKRDFGFEARFTHFPIAGRCSACAD